MWDWDQKWAGLTSMAVEPGADNDDVSLVVKALFCDLFFFLIIFYFATLNDD